MRASYEDPHNTVVLWKGIARMVCVHWGADGLGDGRVRNSAAEPLSTLCTLDRGEALCLNDGPVLLHGGIRPRF